MKLYYKNSGSGSLLIRVGTQKWTIKSGVNPVPDDVGEEILKKGIKGISTDEEAKAAKTERTVALNENSSLKSENVSLKAQVAKLQLIAAQLPVTDEDKDKEIEALKSRIAELESEKPKRGRPAKADTAPAVDSPAIAVATE